MGARPQLNAETRSALQPFVSGRILYDIGIMSLLPAPLTAALARRSPVYLPVQNLADGMSVIDLSIG